MHQHISKQFRDTKLSLSAYLSIALNPNHKMYMILVYFVSGIMLLEKQLLTNRDSGLGPRPAKRARGASAPLPEGTMTWVELGR